MLAIFRFHPATFAGHREHDGISPAEAASILMRIAAGDRESVAQCIDHFSPLVWSLSRRFLANTSDAADAVQEIFTDLWASAARYDPQRSSETTFVAMIARRRLIDRRRRMTRHAGTADLSGELEAADAPHEPSLETVEEAEKVLSLLKTLPPRQQQAIRLSVVDGFSHARVAERLALPLGTVKTHIRRGLARLRGLFARDSLAEVAS